MSNNVTGVGTRLSAIAIAQEANKLKAVELREETGAFEVLWTKSSETDGADWRLFAAECGLSVEQTEQTKGGGGKMVVVGFSSAGVAFYPIGVPSAGKEEIAAMVRLQAETRLPLPAEQMELVWRAGRVQDRQLAVTVAAARREHLQKFVENLNGFEPAKILLDCEGIIKAWRTFFSGNDRAAVVVSIAARNTQVCLAEGGRLSNAVVLDTGMEDFSEATRNLPVSAYQGSAEQTEAVERFTQDMRSVLELFGYAEPAELPVFVLSDGSGAIENIVSCLVSAGLNAQAALPETKKLAAQRVPGIEDVYEYRVPIGLALMALEGDGDELNIFGRLYKPAGKKEKRHWLYSPRIAGAIAAVMLAAMLIMFYAVDVAKLNAIEEHLRETRSETGNNSLMQRQKLIRTVALQRPDILQLLKEINSVESSGIMLDSFSFKKGRPVSISGQASKSEQLYKFEESLQERKSITDVRRTSNLDQKSKKVKFTITFHYKSFTRKRSRT